MPGNIILKKSEKIPSPKNSKKKPKMAIFLALQGRLLTLFNNFLQMTSKHAKKHQIKKSEKFIHW